MSLDTESRAPAPHSPEETPVGRSGRLGSTLRAALVLVVLASGVVFVWSAVSTSTARVSGTTSGNSFFAAGTVDLAQPGTAVELLFNADGLFPGLEARGCVEIEYGGSIPSSVRLHAKRLGGDGLEDFIDLHIVMATAGDCESADELAGVAVFDGGLGQMWRQHFSYDSAIVLDREMEASDRLVLQAAAVVLDDNAAQGLTTDFAITVEARP